MEAELAINDRTEAISEKFLGISKVAEVCDCSEKHVRRLIDRGELVAHRIGRVISIAPKDFESFLKPRRD